MLTPFVIGALLSAAPICTPLDPSKPTLLVVTSRDPGLLAYRPAIESALRRVATDRLSLVDRKATLEALNREGGHDKRAAAFVEASSLVARAEERFRELDTEEALAIIAKATAQLASIHAEPGATELLAHAHFLAAAIYLARDRVDAARNRMLRALDLHPDISPPRHRYAPRVLAELAAVRSASSIREVGRLEVRLPEQEVAATVFIDGASRGTAPLTLDALGVGRHLVRVVAKGYVSWISTIAIEPRKDVTLEVSLQRDPELEQIDGLAQAIRTNKNLDAAIALLARRAHVKQVVVGSIGIAAKLDALGTATVAVDLLTSSGGHAFASTMSELDVALVSASGCQSSSGSSVAIAPPILGLGIVTTGVPKPVPEPIALWNRPWFWALVAVATIGVTGGLFASRTGGGPPNEVGVTLIPRPKE